MKSLREGETRGPSFQEEDQEGKIWVAGETQKKLVLYRFKEETVSREECQLCKMLQKVQISLDSFHSAYSIHRTYPTSETFLSLKQTTNQTPHTLQIKPAPEVWEPLWNSCIILVFVRRNAVHLSLATVPVPRKWGHTDLLSFRYAIKCKNSDLLKLPLPSYYFTVPQTVFHQSSPSGDKSHPFISM